MRNAPNVKINRHRIREGAMGSDDNYGNNGAFLVPVNGKHGVRTVLTVVASDEDGWDHVSVSTPSRCPTWEEMAFIKDLFFKDDECVLQYHPPKSAHVNDHPYCLHMWRPQEHAIPLPPSWMVGPNIGAEKLREIGPEAARRMAEEQREAQR